MYCRMEKGKTKGKRNEEERNIIGGGSAKGGQIRGRTGGRGKERVRARVGKIERKRRRAGGKTGEGKRSGRGRGIGEREREKQERGRRVKWEEEGKRK